MERLIKKLIFSAMVAVFCMGTALIARENQRRANNGSFRQNSVSAPANIQSERSFSGGFSRSETRQVQPRMLSAPVVRQTAPVPQMPHHPKPWPCALCGACVQDVFQMPSSQIRFQ